MSRKKTLVKNIFIFGLGTSLSKIMSVLLVGFYSRKIPEADYGYYGFLITMTLALLPFVSLQITDALYRDVLATDDKKAVASSVTNAIVIIFGGIAVSCAGLVTANLLTTIQLGWILPGYVATHILLIFSKQTARGLRRNTVYAMSDVVYTGAMVAANLILILRFGMGVEALLYSTMIADVTAVVFIECTAGAFRRIRPSLISGQKIREMLRYSIPLLPNVVTWYLLMIFNRAMILYFEGWDANGLFEMASKFPALLMTIFGIFTLAWQENSILEYDAPDRNEYYSKTFSMYLRLFTGGLLLLLPVTRFIAKILLGGYYDGADAFIPFLYLGTIFQSFSYFFATVYMGAKKTTGAFATMVIGVIGGMAVCAGLMPLIGTQAAALAHMSAFLIAWLLRVWHTRKYAHVRLDLPVLLLMAALSGVYVACYFLGNATLDVLLFLAAIPVFLFVNRGLIVLMLGMAQDFFRRKR